MVDRSQLMRGTLEGCIVKLIGLGPTYGYEIVSRLQRFGFDDVKEGTIYPILVRLEKKALVQTEYRPSPLGPGRKYYTLTKAGKALLAEFRTAWEQVVRSVGTILQMEAWEEEPIGEGSV